MNILFEKLTDLLVLETDKQTGKTLSSSQALSLCQEAFGPYLQNGTVIATEMNSENTVNAVVDIYRRHCEHCSVCATHHDALFFTAKAISQGIGLAVAYAHTSKLAKNEPAWSSIDKTKLPREAFADRGKKGLKSTWRYPHHWIKNNTMYLHRGGLAAALQAAGGARSGVKAPPFVVTHLKRHAKDIGMKGY